MINENEIIVNELTNSNNWGEISKYQYLTEEFIEKYKDKLYWNSISRYQKLSESFIERYKDRVLDRKSTRLNSSHANISYAVFCLKKKKHLFQYLHPVKHPC